MWGLIIMLVEGAVILLALAILCALVYRFRHTYTERGTSEYDRNPEQRAATLLRDLLDEHEFLQLTKHDYLDVASPTESQRIYRIPRYGGRVIVFEHGRVTSELCVQSAEPLPSSDVILLHKLMIQGNEQGYVASANVYPILFPYHSYHCQP